jgi:hypothetical protein
MNLVAGRHAADTGATTSRCLIAAQGANAKMTDLTLANCKNARSQSASTTDAKRSSTASASDLNHSSTMLWRVAAESVHCRQHGDIQGAAVIQDVFSALWFIAFLIVVYGIPLASSLFVETR